MPWIDGVYVNAKVWHALHAAEKLAKHRPVNVLFIGPSGAGKTDTARAFAAEHDMSLVFVNVPLIRDPEELYGTREARSGRTTFELSEFSEAVVRGNCVIVLDELNRAEPWILNGILPILDFRRATTVHGIHVVVGKNVIFVATMNIGLSYFGTFQSDAALVNRFEITARLDWPPQQAEVMILQKRVGISSDAATRIVATMRELRKKLAGTIEEGLLSPRTSLAIANVVHLGGLGVREAFEVVFSDSVPPEARREATDIINTTNGVLSWDDEGEGNNE